MIIGGDDYSCSDDMMMMMTMMWVVPEEERSILVYMVGRPGLPDPNSKHAHTLP